MSKKTVITVVGTRPELIRLSRLIPLLDLHFNHVLVHTGQNPDPQLNRVFFDELGIRAPDHYLAANGASLGQFLGDVLQGAEKIFQDCKADAVVILGDTNSAIAALIAKRMQIPVYHLEAGNRSFDENVPEETNRRMVDHIADFNLAYTEHARRNLLAEGLSPRRILVTGSPMGEVLKHYRKRIDASTALAALGLQKGKYFLVSAHRQENVDSVQRLLLLLETLRGLQKDWGVPILVSTHPRTKKRLADLPEGGRHEGITFHEPFGFFDYVTLQKNALAVLSDSGTISEEAAILGFPAVTIRDSMERPEALDSGSIVMTGLGIENVTAGLNAVIGDSRQASNLPAGYEVENFSERVLRFMQSTIDRHHEWAGIRIV
jgi:UDP-N-acetylglucosamine 2-epimerase